MSENNQKPTRQELHRNHKRNNLLVVIGIIAAAFLGLVLLYNIFYGNDETPSIAANNQTNSQNMIITESADSSETSSSAGASSEKENKEEKDKKEKEETETETKEVPSTDENVAKACCRSGSRPAPRPHRGSPGRAWPGKSRCPVPPSAEWLRAAAARAW